MILTLSNWQKKILLCPSCLVGIWSIHLGSVSNMVGSCVMYGCHSRQKKGGDISFFHFPHKNYNHLIFWNRDELYDIHCCFVNMLLLEKISCFKVILFKCSTCQIVEMMLAGFVSLRASIQVQEVLYWSILNNMISYFTYPLVFIPLWHFYRLMNNFMRLKRRKWMDIKVSVIYSCLFVQWLQQVNDVMLVYLEHITELEVWVLGKGTAAAETHTSPQTQLATVHHPMSMISVSLHINY